MAADTRRAAAPIVPADLAASPQTPTTAPEPRALLQQLAGWMQASGYGPDHPWCMAVAASLAAHPAVPAAAADDKPMPAESVPCRWPTLVGTAPLFNIGATVYAARPGADLPSLLMDLHHLLNACEGIMATISEDLTSCGIGGLYASACAAYGAGLLMLRQCASLGSLVQGMSEFPDRPGSWGVVAAGQPSEGGAA